jgi:hypothetical protein
MMDQKILLYAVSAVFLLLLIVLILIKVIGRTRYPYQAKPILTRRENHFYWMLRRETDRRGLLVCPKVGLKDLLAVNTRRQYMKYFHRIAQKHVDFVICDKSLNVLFALELDDSSHDTEDARCRDHFKDRAFKAAHIPLKRIRNYDEEAIRKLFN